MTFEEKFGPQPLDTYGMALWQTAKAAWDAAQAAMRERAALKVEALELIPQHMATAIRALPIE
jgi:hypothetical protein